MMIILILSISNIMYIFNLQIEHEAYDNELSHSILNSHLPFNILNSIIYSYNLTLGEFDTDRFEGEH